MIQSACEIRANISRYAEEPGVSVGPSLFRSFCFFLRQTLVNLRVQKTWVKECNNSVLEAHDNSVIQATDILNAVFHR